MHVQDSQRGSLADTLRAIADGAAALPGVRRVARPLLSPLVRRRFRRPYGSDNSYYGVYASYAEASAAAQAQGSRQ